MLVEIRLLSELIPYEKNARKIPQAAVDAVALSLKTYGWQQPIVVDKKGVIVAGHTRRLAALQLGMTKAPVVLFEGTAVQARAFRLADNRTHDETSWEPEALKLEMLDLNTLNLDMALTGFSSRELDALLRPAIVDEDETPELTETAITQPGDMWTLGEHRLLCGDSTDAEAVKRGCGEARPLLMVTDPPYGVNYDPAWRLDAGVHKPWQKRAEGKVNSDDRADWREAWKLFPGDIVYVWHGALHAAKVAESLEASEFEIRSQVIWAKKCIVMGRGHYHWQHEPCWYAVRKSKPGNWKGDRKQSTLWAVENMHVSQGNVDDGKTNHSTQKPVEVMRRPILNHTKAGDYVYDPFLGSGTTLIAAEATERRCLAIELDPLYVDMAVKRWMNLTGKTAYNQDGVVFPA